MPLWISGCGDVLHKSHFIHFKLLFTLGPPVPLCFALGFFSFMGQRLCGDVLHKSQQRTRGRDLRSCLWQDQIRWLLSKSGNHVVMYVLGISRRFGSKIVFVRKLGPKLGPALARHHPLSASRLNGGCKINPNLCERAEGLAFQSLGALCKFHRLVYNR